MRELLTLIHFEFKKIVRKKSTCISLALLFILTLGMALMGISHYEDIQKNRTNQKALAGRTVDEELLLEIQDAYRHINPDDKNYWTTKDFEIYVRPYSSVQGNILSIYSSLKQFQNTSKEDIKAFYSLREAKLVSELKEASLTDQEIKLHLKLNSKLITPLAIANPGGYYSLHTYFAFILSFCLIFVTAICLAPIFSGEYSSNTAQFILTTKCRNKEILAKILTGVLFSTLISLFYLLIFLFINCIINGFGGAGSSFQHLKLLSTYPLTMLNSCIFLILCNIAVNLLVSGITLLLSSRFKSTFGVIIITILILIVPQFLSISNKHRMIFDLINMLPSRMINPDIIYGIYMYNIPGGPVWPYLFIPIFSIIFAIIMFIPAYHSFKKHQVG